MPCAREPGVQLTSVGRNSPRPTSCHLRLAVLQRLPGLPVYTVPAPVPGPVPVPVNCTTAVSFEYSTWYGEYLVTQGHTHQRKPTNQTSKHSSQLPSHPLYSTVRRVRVRKSEPRQGFGIVKIRQRHFLTPPFHCPFRDCQSIISTLSWRPRRRRRLRST